MSSSYISYKSLFFWVLYHGIILLPSADAFPLSKATSLRSQLQSRSLSRQQQQQQLHSKKSRRDHIFILYGSIPSWEEISKSLPSLQIPPSTKSIDSALDPSSPNYSTDHPTLFRERHGWCPYSERAWLTLEHKNIPYDTIRIDNTGPGVKPPYYSGQTPQIKWENGKTQGESMDIVKALDDKSYPSPALESGILYNHGDNDNMVKEKISAWKEIFPSARPSSRAAFLFSWSGEPLPKSEFERVLSETDDLLQSTSGPFFCGTSFTAADVAWTPFLERYGAQLPCLHDDLHPMDESTYPHLFQWYQAMQNQIPAYACRVKGDASSWRKVLSMAGFGNMGNVPTDIRDRMDMQQSGETDHDKFFLSNDDIQRQQRLWKEYISTRDYLASSPEAEAAAILVRNRGAIIQDIERRVKLNKEWQNKLPLRTESGLDDALRTLTFLLMNEGESKDVILATQEDLPTDLSNDVGALASFLDERMCVPRDMGEMSASAIKRISARLQS